MSKIDGLFPDVTRMSDEELLEHIRQVRKDRRVTKNSGKRKVSVKAKTKATDELKDLLKHMTPEQRRGFLA